jgi:hypothetical protein
MRSASWKKLNDYLACTHHITASLVSSHHNLRENKITFSSGLLEKIHIILDELRRSIERGLEIDPVMTKISLFGGPNPKSRQLTPSTLSLSSNIAVNEHKRHLLLYVPK